MTRRRNPLLVLAVFAVWSMAQGGRTQPVTRGPQAPHDSGAEFRDDVPEPDAADELTVEIVLPDKLPAGEFIPFKLRHNGSLANIDYLVDWKPAGGHLLKSADGGHVTHVPGPHTLTVFGAIDGTAVLHSAPFVIEGAVPGPTPPGPQPPTPQRTLRDLVPNAEHRAQLAEFYADMAGVVKAGGFTSLATFREGQQSAIKTSQAMGKLPKGLAAINTPINDRLVAAVGKADVPLDEAKRAALVAALESIAAEFGGE